MSVGAALTGGTPTRDPNPPGTTDTLLAQRRMRTLARLVRELRGPVAVLAETAAAVLAGNAEDHPAGALYAVTDTGPQFLAGFGDLPAEPVAAVLAACAAHGGPTHDAAAGLHVYPVHHADVGPRSHLLLLAQQKQQPFDEALNDYFDLVARTVEAALLSEHDSFTERRRTSDLAALDAAKSAFLAGISHEFRTPLALISAPVQDVLERDPGLAPDSRERLALVQDNVERLGRMVEALLDFSRMEAGRLVPALEEVDVSLLTAGLAASFAPAFERAGLAFGADIPALSGPALLDRDFFERIVSNLLSNALKFTPSGRVDVHLREGEGHYVVEVSDTGLGIAPEDQQRVFHRFERLAPAPGARSSAGAGIGLAMVRDLSRLLDGDADVASVPGAGSTFTVRLPFRPSVRAGVTGQSVTPRHVASFLTEIDRWVGPDPAPRSGPDGAPRLLLAEDDPELARFLADCLRTEYAVTLVGDGVAALEVLRDAGADLVLTDVTMPSMGGLELVSEIRRDPALRQLPVVLLSSSGGDAAAATGLLGGADDYLTKPFSLVDLRGRLAANLARVRERSADTAWRQAIMASLRDPLLVLDTDGQVVELNQAFTNRFGYTLADGPIRPPYPWWPTEEELPGARDQMTRLLEDARARREVETEVLFYTRDREPVWVHSTGSAVEQPDGRSTRIRVLRDITKEKQAQQRRSAAAVVSSDFARVDDLGDLLGVAEHGFELLFDGGSTIQLDLGERFLFGSGRRITAEDLTAQIATGLAGSPSPDTTSLRPGILLVPQTSTIPARAWVQFPRPRRIGIDEMIAADLLAQAFGLAVDRVITLQRAADRQANLEQALESHRLIGQAVGILVERHRLLPSVAFDRLRHASQARNLKLREIATRVIETGAEPETA
jgi:PAS domain S-box-containing protein